MIVLVLLLPLLALFAFENEHVAEHRYVDVLGVDTRQLGRDLVHLLVLTHVDRRRRKAERTAPRRFGCRTSGAAKGSRTRCRTDRTADPSRHGRTAIHREGWSAPAAPFSLRRVPLPSLSPSVRWKGNASILAMSIGGTLIQRNSSRRCIPSPRS